MDEAVIDLDMEKIVEQIAEQDLLRARNVYRDGGHSKSFAILTLQSPPPNKSLKKSTLVAGWTEKSTRVFGSVLEDVSWQQPSPDGITIKVLYDLKNTEPCQSGGLFTLRAANRDGCTYCADKDDLGSFQNLLSYQHSFV